MSLGPCARRIVRASIVTEDGEIFHGENDCDTPQKVCPRGSMRSGEGWDLCKSVCHQRGHAEIRALEAAGTKADNGVMHIYGHYFMCRNCAKAVNAAGIRQVTIYESQEDE